MKSFAFKFPRVSHIGNTVSHAKNRKKRAFKYNLHTVTVMIEGKKQRMRVPTKVLKMLRKSGMTTHYKPADKKSVNKPVEKVTPEKASVQPQAEVKVQPATKAQEKAKPAKKAKAKKK
jgi:ribosomal protein L28